MKKYYNFINEETISGRRIDDILDDVFDRCKPYIDIIKSCDGQRLLFRGFNFKGEDIKDDVLLSIYAEKHITIKEIKHRWNRIPLDTPEEIHDLLNTKFVEKFGWEARNGVFCYLKDATHNTSTGYGVPYMIFPIGDFEYLWSPNVFDLYGDNQAEIEMYMNQDEYFDELIEEDWESHCDGDNELYNNQEELQKFIDMRMETFNTDFIEHLDSLVNTYKDTDICKTTQVREITLNCDSYYLIDKLYLDNIKKRIWGKEENPQ
jgi:hypothetical protein